MGLAMGRRASQIRGIGELLRIPPGLVLLSYAAILFWVQVKTEDLLPRSELETVFVISPGTPLSGKSAVSCQTALCTSTVPLTDSVGLAHRLRNKFPHVMLPPLMVSASRDLGLVTTIGQPSSSSSHLSKPSMQKNQHLAPTLLIVASPSGTKSTSEANSSLVPLGLAEPPISYHSAPAAVMLPNSRPPSMSYLHKSNDDARGANQLNLTIIVGICAALLVVVIVAVLVIYLCTSWKGKKKSQTRETAKLKSLDTKSAASSLPCPTSTRFLAYEELKEATNNFEPAGMLGEGGFGRVFKGILSDGTAVAIKKLSSPGYQEEREFLVEIEMLSRLHHRNLVKLVGYYSSGDSLQNLLCYELVPNGSLESWLHGPLGANCPLDWDTRMKIALDSARGLAYLHEDSQPSVIHRDFKAANILLENNFHAKVSDFGLARQAPEGCAHYLSTRVMGTFGYVAPEYAMTGHLLVKSDVYSYGVVLLELLTGRRPVDMWQPSGQENLVTWARPILRDKDRLEDLADPKLDGKYPMEDFLRVCTIAAACVAPEVSQRPAMGEVVQSLKMVQRLVEHQDTMPAPSARPNIRQSSTTYESDGTSSMFSSGPLSGLRVFDNDNISRTAIFSEDLHEGR